MLREAASGSNMSKRALNCVRASVLYYNKVFKFFFFFRFFVSTVKKLTVKFGFSEKATKFEKNLCHTFDKSIVFCAHNSVLVKKLTKI